MQIRHFLPHILGTRLQLERLSSSGSSFPTRSTDWGGETLPIYRTWSLYAVRIAPKGQVQEVCSLSPLPTIGLAGFSPKTHYPIDDSAVSACFNPQKLQEISTNDACRLGSYSLFLEPQKVALILSQPIPLYCLVNTSPYCQ